MWLKQDKFISQSSGEWKSKIKVLVDLVPSETSFLGLHMATFLLRPHMSFICVCTSLVSLLCVQIPSYKTISKVGFRPTLTVSF